MSVTLSTGRSQTSSDLLILITVVIVLECVVIILQSSRQKYRCSTVKTLPLFLQGVVFYLKRYLYRDTEGFPNEN